MHIKKYTIGTMLLFLVIGLYTFYFVSDDSFSMELFGVNLPQISISLLVLFPVLILYIASVAHMLFHSVLDSFKMRQYKTDYDKLILLIMNTFLGKTQVNIGFKTKRYKLIASLISNSQMHPSSNMSSIIDNDDVNAVLKTIKDIEDGKFVDLKKYNLQDKNELFARNIENGYKKNKISAEDILGNEEKYKIEIRKKIYSDYVKTASMKSIEKYKSNISKETLFCILSRINAEKHMLDVSVEKIFELSNLVSLNSDNYLEISHILSRNMIPEDRIKLLDMMSVKDDSAMDAYLFTLLDLEVLDLAKAILDISQVDEYLNFKAYMELKENDKHFNINLFVK